MKGAAYAACVEKARFSRMNGYGSHSKPTASELRTIQMTTTTVWPTMYLGVPKNLASFSEVCPKRSTPNGARRCSSGVDAQ
jgi:hypothetical protein